VFRFLLKARLRKAGLSPLVDFLKLSEWDAFVELVRPRTRRRFRSYVTPHEVERILRETEPPKGPLSSPDPD
jgi:hypothetical protein